MNHILNRFPVTIPRILAKVYKQAQHEKTEFFVCRVMITPDAPDITIWTDEDASKHMEKVVNLQMSSSKLGFLVNKEIYIIRGHINRSKGSRIDIDIQTMTYLGTTRSSNGSVLAMDTFVVNKETHQQDA